MLSSGTYFVSFLIFVIARCLYLMFNVFRGKRRYHAMRTMNETVKTAIVIGSGGHTTEMLKVTQLLDPQIYFPRIYIMANSDIISDHKIEEVEKLYSFKSEFIIKKIPRSRNVFQSYFTSIMTTIWATLACIPLIVKHQPELILSNGPGTCIPVCLVAFLLRALFLSNNSIVFIESICRVKSLSVSGKILLFFADNVLVQWPELQLKYRRTKYLGRV